MRLNCYEEVKHLTSALVAIPSVNKLPGGESAAARYIQDYYMALPYFQAHPDQVRCFPTENDALLRHCTMAWVKGTRGKSRRTVILMGHIDTVGVEDFGPIRNYAFSSAELPAKLKETFSLSGEVLSDMASGEYMFGRGALDMKSGVAGQMVLMAYFSRHPEELDGNLLHLAECDEEDGSRGILTALDHLLALGEQEGFVYTACINADYSTVRPGGDESRCIYYGSVGKLLPTFVAFGKEAHVGDPFSAFDPNLLLSEVTRSMALNPALCDVAQGEMTVPPISLKQADTKGDYTVQTALSAMAYYNFFTHAMGPDEVLEKCRRIGEDAFGRTVDLLNSRYREYCRLSGIPFAPLPWHVRVYTWREFYGRAARRHGQPFRDAVDAFARDLHRREPAMDLRRFSLAVAQEVWRWYEDKSPALVVFFGSVYYGRVEMGDSTPREQALRRAVERAVEAVAPEARRPLAIRMFYPYISDASFMALSDTAEALAAVAENMPAWGVKYVHEAEKIGKLNVPVVNIGPFGHDGHMLTERVDMYHAFQNVPNLTYETVRDLLA